MQCKAAMLQHQMERNTPGRSAIKVTATASYSKETLPNKNTTHQYSVTCDVYGQRATAEASTFNVQWPWKVRQAVLCSASLHVFRHAYPLLWYTSRRSDPKVTGGRKAHPINVDDPRTYRHRALTPGAAGRRQPLPLQILHLWHRHRLLRHCHCPALSWWKWRRSPPPPPSLRLPLSCLLSLRHARHRSLLASHHC